MRASSCFAVGALVEHTDGHQGHVINASSTTVEVENLSNGTRGESPVRFWNTVAGGDLRDVQARIAFVRFR